MVNLLLSATLRVSALFYGPSSGIKIHNRNISMYVSECEFCELIYFTF
jgi:hypothetical protein